MGLIRYSARAAIPRPTRSNPTHGRASPTVMWGILSASSGLSIDARLSPIGAIWNCAQMPKLWSAAEIFLYVPTPLIQSSKNFSNKLHYAMASRALHASWFRNPELDFIGRLHFCFVDILHNNCNGALCRIKFQKSVITACAEHFNKNSNTGLNRGIALPSIIFACMSNAQEDLK